MRFLPTFENFKMVLHSAAATHMPNVLSTGMAALQLGSSVKDLDLRAIVLSSLITLLPGVSRVLTPNTDYKDLLAEMRTILNRIDAAGLDKGIGTLTDMANDWRTNMEKYDSSLTRTDHSIRTFSAISLFLLVSSGAFALGALGYMIITRTLMLVKILIINRPSSLI